MKAVTVLIKRNGLIFPCMPHPAPDGATWQCGCCGAHPILRASFGLMSGVWRCVCGGELELIVDGVVVPIEEVAEVENTAFPIDATAAPAANVPAKPKRKRHRKLKDEDFLRECGIADPEETK